MAVFLDCSCKSLTVLECKGYIFSPRCLLPSEEDRIPPQTLKSGAGVECCLEGNRTSGLESWSEDPPDCTLFEGIKLSWELAEGHQGPTQSRSHPRPDAGYLPGGRLLRKEGYPSTDRGKNLLRLSQLFLLPSGDPCGRI